MAHSPVSAATGIPISSDNFRVHAALDAGIIGSEITLPLERIMGYYRGPLTDDTADQDAYEQVQRDNPRKKNIYRGDAKIWGKAVQPRWETINYKGTFKGYRGSEVYADYQSCLCVSRSGRSVVKVAACKIVRRLLAPAGMKFDADSNGVMVRRLTDGMDYHPTPEEWAAKNFATLVRAGMAKNFAARRAAKRVEKLAAKNAREAARLGKIMAREINSVRVTLEDSRRAGNCVEGALRYAETRLRIDRQTVLDGGYLFSVSAGKLLATNGDAGVKRAVDSAWTRETTVSI